MAARGAGGTGAGGRVQGAAFAVLVIVVCALELWAVQRHSGRRSAGARAGVGAKIGSEALDLERTLLTQQKEVTGLLRELNSRDLQINYLNRRNAETGRLLGSYRTALERSQEQTARSKASESELTGNVNKRKYSSDDTDIKVERVVRITKKGLNNDTRVLVDAQKNEYILSAPHAPSSQEIDETFLTDLGVLITASAVSGLLAARLGQPIMLGYLVGGMAIGPGGFGLIQQYVQVETLAQLGATFLLFGLGVEFKWGDLAKVRGVAIGGGAAAMAGMVISTCCICTLALGITRLSGAFFGCILAMSSTTMAVRALMESNETTSLHGRITVGFLVVQDIALAAVLSLMPILSDQESNAGQKVAQVMAKLALTVAVVAVCSRVWPRLLTMLHSAPSHDLFLLGVCAMCVAMTMVTEKILNSAEVGAFLAGVLVNTAPRDVAEKAMRTFEPVRDIFAALFFSSIGMLINPAYLAKNAIPVAAIVLGVFVGKTIITAAVIMAFRQNHPDLTPRVVLKSAVALANIGEFAFVLANDGVAAGLLAGEAHRVLLGATAVSLLVSPLINQGAKAALSLWLPEEEGGSKEEGCADRGDGQGLKLLDLEGDAKSHDA